MFQVILWVIRCISDFQQHCVSKTVGLRAKHNLHLYFIQFYVVIVCHLIKQSAKPLCFLYNLYIMLYTCILKTFTDSNDVE